MHVLPAVHVLAPAPVLAPVLVLLLVLGAIVASLRMAPKVTRLARAPTHTLGAAASRAGSPPSPPAVRTG